MGLIDAQWNHGQRPHYVVLELSRHWAVRQGPRVILGRVECLRFHKVVKKRVLGHMEDVDQENRFRGRKVWSHCIHRAN